MKEQPKAPSARDMKGNQYTGKSELVEGFSHLSPTLASDELRYWLNCLLPLP
jgi:hypothetical protein